ncbi:pyridoxamine 5'-phosphate oxidase family protein [Belnapia sp. F-4-1]|uniref:pyridoxamine 5'-phosphate oxidase family protein n=1 Tax=Belnapia sp. F-4-1 TaxID=1545443 RepID=UPI0005BA870F|nr:pyridoxamine 5'-phosphate oxidase family protein [Belnapia sp. F-4-1]
MTSQPARDRLTPWHAGEVALQSSLGMAERMAVVGQHVLRDHLIEQHQLFYPQLPFLILGAVDPEGDPWATILAGHPGFLSVPDAGTLRVAAGRDAADPAGRGMEAGDAVGLLGIELPTRRRNRLNGHIRRTPGEEGFAVTVEQSFGNCPRYITPHGVGFARDPAEPAPEGATALPGLDSAALAMIRRADTAFVASYVGEAGPERQVDVSHRGGPRGFIRVEADGALTIPDYAGNMFFNTLGNILMTRRAGLLFVDGATGTLLQLTGAAGLLPEGPELDAFEGAERLWRVTPRRIVRREAALPLRWG